MLTGNKNVDLLILNQLEDKDLISVCQANTIAHTLCQDEGFWLNRIIVKFGISLDILKQYKGDRSWSEYYIKDLRKINKYNASKILTEEPNRLDHIIVARSILPQSKILLKYTLSNASKNGHLDIVKYLVSNGVEINFANNTPLRSAVKNGHLDVVKYLISVGADATVTNFLNQTLIEIASIKGHQDIVDYLNTLEL